MAKKTRRSKVKYASLIKRYNSKIRQEYLDQDYLDQLNEEELEWLNDFMSEYNNASVGKQKDKGKNNRFHKSKDTVKECTDRNNSRNRCLYGIRRASQSLDMLPSDDILGFLDMLRGSVDLSEDNIIDILDTVRQEFNYTKDDSDSDGD